MTGTDLLEELSLASFEIEQSPHPYERATEAERAAYDRRLEERARERELRQRAAVDQD